MTSNFKEDQAEQLRKQLNHSSSTDESEQPSDIDVLSLPSRKEKYKKNTKNEVKEPKERKQKKRRKNRIKFPLVRVLLFLFLLLVVLVLTYPIWIDKL